MQTPFSALSARPLGIRVLKYFKASELLDGNKLVLIFFITRDGRL